MKIILLLLTFKACFCDWVSEWLAPVEFQYKDFSTQNLSDAQFLINPLGSDIERESQYEPSHRADVETFAPAPSPNLLKVKLEEILKNAKTLTETLKKQIAYIENQERTLKEAIANGRSGTTVLTVTTLAQNPRTYFIRDGFWTLCNGIVQYPIATQPHNVFTELFSSPRCIGQEVRARRDPCAFNSLIKYETVPATKRSTYIEDNYLCLKPSFNHTLETYMSVPKRIVEETCKNGVIKTLPENILDCGLRVLLEYVYYPNRSQLHRELAFEYCTEKDGACKLTVGWHLSNTSIENFEFLKTENNFKKFFIKNDHYLEPFI